MALVSSKRRGRPPKAKTAVLRQTRALGVHHFAFLRAWLQGLDLKAAWQRYLAFGEASDDLRHIEHQRSAILHSVLQAGHQLNLGLPAGAKISEALALLSQNPFTPATAALPSLDEFAQAQGFEADQFSQAELMAEYRAFYGLDQPAPDDDGHPAATTAAAGPGLRAQIRALHQVEGLLARTPQPGDPLALWFAPATLPRLKAVGAATLLALRHHIDVAGHGWFKPVRGLGATRAAAVVAWLAPLAEAWGQPLRESALQAPQRLRALRSASLRPLVMAPRFGMVPLAQLAVPAALAGGGTAPGVFASRMANSLGAADDLAALRAWLQPYAESPATHRAYSKEVERFYLWCLHVRRKPLSSVDSTDCLAYRGFLAALPDDWVQPAALPRDDPSWRPFRGPLKPASQRYALVVVQALFDGLREANYLVANPMAAVRKKAQLPEPALNIGRSFSEAEWAFVMGQLDQAELAALSRGRPAAATGPVGRAADGDSAAVPVAPPAGAEQRRLRLVLALLCSTGLRLAELASATRADLAEVGVDGGQGPDDRAWVITVTGKGRRQRQVPVGDDMLALVAAHHADAESVGALPCPAPLVCTLWPGVGRWVDCGAEAGEAAMAQRATPVVAAATPPAPGVALRAAPLSRHRALGANGLYRALKRYFQRISQDARAVDGLSAARIQAASTHWLRHTFGRQGAAAGVPVEVLQQAFGHASLNTTTTYLSTERSRMIRELRDARARRLGSGGR